MRMLQRFKSSIKSLLYPNSSALLKVAPNSNNLVLILGWGGSGPHHYNKIRHYYETKNVSTILHTMPLMCPKFIRTSFEEDIERLVMEHGILAKQQQNLYVHLFSQNGSWTYSNLTNRGNIPQPIKLIMDSAPSFSYDRNVAYEADSLAQLFTSIVLNKAQYYQFPFTPIMKAALYVIMSVSVVTDKLVPNKHHYFTNYLDLHKYFRDHCPPVPTLFLYSEGDQLIPPHKVREFKKHLEERGIPTKEHVFGSEVSHISAMYKYPREYADIVGRYFDFHTTSAVTEKG